MLKLTTTILAVALAGTASAEGWRSLRVDGSSEAAFAESLEAFEDKLSTARHYVFGEALKDIWLRGLQAARAEQRDYTQEEYYRQLDGLGYEEVVTLADPTGEVAKQRYRTASLGARARLRRSPLATGYRGNGSDDHWIRNPGLPRGASPSTMCQQSGRC